NIDIAADKLVEFETAVLPIPQYDVNDPKMISQGPSVCLFNKEDPQEVLASWLFMQYLLTNDVQIAYAETEGYVPVTSKAQNDPAYQDYLSRSGEDYKLHYDVKIQAAKLLMAHTSHTFTTPVFNGSTSVRDAAGQLIEDVTKSVRRKQTVDDAYIEKLYEDTKALYRLDQGTFSGENGQGEGKQDMGPLPGGAVAMLSALAVAWVLIAAWFFYDLIRKKRAAKQQNS
ncbi:MAG: extracellular solute-binding protein, partial [Lachnospiraceae bacterium]|nr:extracellular solute-binding protein [Lachnospiraceae bacterium]